MYFWEDVCTDIKKEGFPHMFALFLAILSVIYALAIGYVVFKKKTTLFVFLFAVLNSVIMWFNWANCREWWEIILWHLILHFVGVLLHFS